MKPKPRSSSQDRKVPVKRKGWDWAVGVDKNFAGEGPDLLELEQCSLGHRLPHFKRCFKAFGICGGGITRSKDIVMRSRRYPGAYALVSRAINDCMPCRRTGAGHRCTRRHPAQSRATGATHPEAASERHRGFTACDSAQTRPTLPVAAAHLGRLPGERGGPPRQAQAALHRTLNPGARPTASPDAFHPRRQKK